MMDKIYRQYAENLAELSTLEESMGVVKRSLAELKDEISECDDSEGYALELSAHAYSNLLSRLHGLSLESTAVYNDAKDLLIPTRLKAFVISLIAKAKEDGNFTKHKGDRELHYNIELNEWSNNTHILVLTVIVEGKVVKTGYFNWIGR